MPGFAGIISLDLQAPINIEQHNGMCQSLMHREWYEKNDLISEKRNYAISRIHHGTMNRQGNPLQDSNADIICFVDGEIYNELPGNISQPMHILSLYKKNGDDFAKFLNGSFLIVIVDNIKKRIIISNDHSASRPLYWYKDQNFLYIAPELKAFLTIQSFDGKVSEDAIASFLYAGYLINRMTYFQNIHVLDSASTIILAPCSMKIKKYWQYTFLKNPYNRGIDEYVEEAEELTLIAVKRSLKGNEQIGMMLSGGFDSRAILGAYYRLKPASTIVTTTWGLEENIPNSDGKLAKNLSNEVHSRHVFFKLDAEQLVRNLRNIVFLGEALTDTTGNYPQGLSFFQFLRERENVRILLRGDQCFGCGGDLVQGPGDVLPAQGIYPSMSSSQYATLIHPERYSHLKERYDDLYHSTFSRCDSAHFHDKKDFFHFDQRLFGYLNPLSALKRIEIEIRNPLIDRDLLDFLMKVPYQHRINKKFFHKMVRTAFPEISKIPIATVNSDIHWNKFIPGNREIQEFIKKELIESENVFDAYINKKELKRYLDNFFSSCESEAGIPPYFSYSEILKKEIKKIKPIVKIIRKFRKPWQTDTDLIIFRMLSLKIWYDVFLSKP